MHIPELDEDIPWLNTEQMIEVDRAMIEDYRIELIQMMENAGRCLAILTKERFLDGDPRQKNVLVMAGSGGNGGGAMVAARRLAAWGSNVMVVLANSTETMTPIPAHQLDILNHMGVRIIEASSARDFSDVPHVILDGLIGYSLKGAPRGLAAELILWSNSCSAPTLALDTPSGLDAALGQVFDPAIRALATLTLALPKDGLRAPGVAANVGELYLADISVPPDLYSRAPLGLKVGPVFARSDIIRLL